MKPKLIHFLSSSLSTKAQGNRGPACLLALVHAVAVPSFANTLTVTNANDSGPGSLRDAIAAANAGDTIEFSVTGTITLTSGSLTVDKNLTIKGPGATQLAIHGNRDTLVFLIGTENASAVSAISGLTVADGGGGTVNIIGGGIYNRGALTLVNCTVSENSRGPFSRTEWRSDLAPNEVKM